MYDGETPYTVASNFARKFNLPQDVQSLLREQIQINMKKYNIKTPNVFDEQTGTQDTA
jgi:hypothetical protein